MEKPRLPAIDVMRGLVMILMTVDHASEVLNSGRVAGDSAGRALPGPPVPLAQFFTRWVTHLCAPTFVLLAGTALALSVASRRAKSATAGAIDRHLATRGLLLIALDLLWMSPAMRAPGEVLLQVLYAIGASFLFMIPLRRLGDGALVATGLLLIVLDEPLLSVASSLGVRDSLPLCLLLGPGAFFGRRLLIGYPVLPWLGIMCLGWVFGRKLSAWPEAEREARAARVMASAGLILVALFLLVRGANGFGNASLLRADGSVAEWLHTSKYPPSVAYDACELGLAALTLSALFQGLAARPGALAWLRTLGQAALFYYLVHLHALTMVAWLFGLRSKLGLGEVWLAAAVTLAVIGPLAARYARLKAAHPRSILQYV